jgi:hypothetical protein
MASGPGPSWNERVFGAVRASREELKSLLTEGGIPPGSAYDFLAEAIESVSNDKWLTCSDPAALLIATVKARLQAGEWSSTRTSQPGKRTTPGRRSNNKRKGGAKGWPGR